MREPKRVLGVIEYDPEFRVDRMTSGLLEFGGRHIDFHVFDAGGAVSAREYSRDGRENRDRDSVQCATRSAVPALDQYFEGQ